MTETTTIKGRIEAWAKNPTEFGNGDKGSRGLKLEGKWHNLLGAIEDLKAIDKTFPKGSAVTFKESQNDKGYWDIEGNIESDQGAPVEDVKDNKDNYYRPPCNPEDQRWIRLQCALKASTEIAKVGFQKLDPETKISVEEIYKQILDGTEKLFKGMEKVKEDLQQQGEW